MTKNTAKNKVTKSNAKKRKVSVVAVSLNEAKTILDVLKKIPMDVVDEILVVDGRSTDGTYELVKKAGYKIVYQEGKGRGAAFRTGFKQVKGDIIVMLSSDGNERPGDIRNLVNKINEGYDLVIAARFGQGKSDDVTPIRNFGNWALTASCNLFGGIKVSDSMNGFRALTRDAMERMNIQANDFSIEGEITVKAGKLKMKIAEVPTIEDARLHGYSRLSTLKDGWRIFKRIVKVGLQKPPYKK